MKKLTDYEYELRIPYENEKDLEEKIDEIVREADRQADMRNCFIEIGVSALDGSEKSWY
jgi:hypothetical protein